MGWRVRIDLEYDGSGYAGWQVQPGRRTVQGVLAGLLARVGEEALPTGAGRTDAGVHALAAVAHADLVREWDAGDLGRALAALSPSDLRILGVRRAEPGFHARFDAVARGYHYALAGEEDPFFRRRRHHVRRLPDPGWAAAELASIRGAGDFASLARSGAETRTTRCVIREAAWVPAGNGALVRVVADRFLYGMVRALVGTLLGGAAAGEPPGHLARVLAGRDRGGAGAAAPPQGLYLTEVRYPGEPESDRTERVARLAGLDRGEAAGGGSRPERED